MLKSPCLPVSNPASFWWQEFQTGALGALFEGPLEVSVFWLADMPSCFIQLESGTVHAHLNVLSNPIRCSIYPSPHLNVNHINRTFHAIHFFKDLCCLHWKYISAPRKAYQWDVTAVLKKKRARPSDFVSQSTQISSRFTSCKWALISKAK